VVWVYAVLVLNENYENSKEFPNWIWRSIFHTGSNAIFLL